MIYTTDRTTIETDWTCGQRRYWYKHAMGTGIVPTVEPEYFAAGKELHGDICSLVLGERSLDSIHADIDLTTTDQLKLEENLRRAGWLVAFDLYIKPYITQNYDIIATERECILTYTEGADTLHHAFTPDLEVRRKSDGVLGMMDWKTTGSLSFGWAHKWPSQVQMHLNMAGMEQEYGEKVGFGFVLGLYKGYWGRGYTSHPYIYAYRNNKGEWGDRGWKGWEQFYSSEYPGGVSAWVEFLGEAGKNKVFRWSDPIHLDRRLTGRLLADRLRRERKISQYLDQAEGFREGFGSHNELFEARFSQCTPQIGSPCPYKEACWNATIGDNPVSSGHYVPRTPHHEIELV